MEKDDVGFIIEDARKFSGITIAEPFIEGKFIKKTKEGNNLYLKRYLVVYGHYDKKLLIFKIVKIPQVIESRENREKRWKQKNKGKSASEIIMGPRWKGVNDK